MNASLAARLRGRAQRELVGRRHRRRGTYGGGVAATVRPLLGDLRLPGPLPALAPTAARYTEGWFDLLGSGWRPFTTAVGGLDWHTDVLSGHRWDPATWHRDLDITPRVGVDVKLPWELGRLQHLPQLALAARYGNEPDSCRRAIEDHLVDFVTSNPPGRGVQWGCAMDAGIRVANILLTVDLLGDDLPPRAQSLVAASVDAHARFILANLEWTRAARGNHYLADVCGLLWAAAHLEDHDAADAWLCLAARELQGETRRQFDRDGANREGSTSYHRLSSEMVVWTTAVLLALPAERLRSLRPRASDIDDVPPSLRDRPLSPDDVAVAPSHLRAIARMPDLSRAAGGDGRSVAQIGDNDSGRFVKVAPAFLPLTVGDVKARYANLDGYRLLPDDEIYWWEDPTDHRHLGAAVQGLLGAPGDDLDGAIVHAYVRHARPAPRLASSVTVRVAARPTNLGDGARRETSIVPGGADLLDDVETVAFVPFGLYVWRSRRLFLAVRCGPVGQDGTGGHDHRDQLSVELRVDGMPWFRDPGSATYTRHPDVRNAYRSAGAHAGPAPGPPEDWDRAGGLFTLGPLAAPGIPRRYAPASFVGECAGVVRSVDLRADRIDIVDVIPGGTPCQLVVRSAAAAALITRPVPFSPGYGWQERVSGREGRPRP